MRLVPFLSGSDHKLGIEDDGEILDIAAVHRLIAHDDGLRGERLDRFIASECPVDIGEFFAVGDRTRANAERAREWARQGGQTRRDALRSSGVLIEFSAARFSPPLSTMAVIFCVGYNYAAHGAEAGVTAGGSPELFMRGRDTVVAHGQPLLRPEVSDRFDFEGELAVVIGRPCHRVSSTEALQYVGGYSCFNDGSLRDYQKQTPLPTPGKNFFASGSMGPWLVTSDEVPDPQGLSLTTTVNDEVLQSAPTAEMIFDVAHLVSYISEFAFLQPGDVIATGTPAGIGFRRDPQRFLAAGDVVTVEISGVGTLRNDVVDETTG